MWYLPHNNEFHQISLDIYNNCEFITSVCLGISELLYLKEEKSEYIIQNKKITGLLIQKKYSVAKEIVYQF